MPVRFSVRFPVAETVTSSSAIAGQIRMHQLRCDDHAKEIAMDAVFNQGSSPLQSIVTTRRRAWDAFAEDIYRAWLRREQHRAGLGDGESIDESLESIRMWWRI